MNNPELSSGLDSRPNIAGMTGWCHTGDPDQVTIARRLNACRFAWKLDSPRPLLVPKLQLGNLRQGLFCLVLYSLS